MDIPVTFEENIPKIQEYVMNFTQRKDTKPAMV
jgi:hypothetical protein